MNLLKVLRQWRRCPGEAGEDPGHEGVAGGAGGPHLVGGLDTNNCWDGNTHVQLMAGQHTNNIANCIYRNMLK